MNDISGYALDPDIKRAMDAGYSLKQIADPDTQKEFGEAVQEAAEEYGPRSIEVEEAIDAANDAAVMLTSARAAYDRLSSAT